jgi:hypothetical protein
MKIFILMALFSAIAAASYRFDRQQTAQAGGWILRRRSPA